MKFYQTSLSKELGSLIDLFYRNYIICVSKGMNQNYLMTTFSSSVIIPGNCRRKKRCPKDSRQTHIPGHCESLTDFHQTVINSFFIQINCILRLFPDVFGVKETENSSMMNISTGSLATF